MLETTEESFFSLKIAGKITIEAKSWENATDCFSENEAEENCMKKKMYIVLESSCFQNETAKNWRVWTQNMKLLWLRFLIKNSNNQPQYLSGEICRSKILNATISNKWGFCAVYPQRLLSLSNLLMLLPQFCAFTLDYSIFPNAPQKSPTLHWRWIKQNCEALLAEVVVVVVKEENV